MARWFRRLGRYVALILWFGIPGGWIYYVVLGVYALVVATALWLFSRPGWIPFLGGWIVLLDGFTVALVLLHRWLNHRLRQHDRPSR